MENKMIDKEKLAVYHDELMKTHIAGGCVFDISAYHATGTPPVLATYANLQAALGTNGANIPESMRKGGMSVKFIQGSAPSSDNQYVQARCMAQNFTTDVTQWQSVDDELTDGSMNLPTSGGTKKYVDGLAYSQFVTGGSVNASTSGTADWKYIDLDIVRANNTYLLKVACATAPTRDTKIYSYNGSSQLEELATLKAGETSISKIITPNSTFNKVRILINVADNNGALWSANIYNLAIPKSKTAQIISATGFSINQNDDGTIDFVWSPTGNLYLEVENNEIGKYNINQTFSATNNSGYLVFDTNVRNIRIEYSLTNVNDRDLILLMFLSNKRGIFGELYNYWLASKNRSDITELQKFAEDVKFEQMELGDFVNGEAIPETTTYSDRSITPSTTTIISNTVAYPYNPCTLKVEINKGYKFAIATGYNPNTTTAVYYSENRIINLPFDRGGCFFRVAIKKVSGGDIAPDSNHGLKIYFKKAYDTYSVNAAIVERLSAYKTVGFGQNIYRVNNDAYPIICHISDTHSDIVRQKNEVEFADSIDADVNVHTGDFCLNTSVDGFTASSNTALLGKIPNLFVKGNHDARPWWQNGQANFDALFKKLGEKHSYVYDTDNLPNLVNYYVDITARGGTKMRFICVDLYNASGTKKYSTSSIQWFADTLAATPADTLVFCCAHQPMDTFFNYSGKKFCDTAEMAAEAPNDYNNYFALDVAGGTPYIDIVDSFILKEHLTKSWTFDGVNLSVDIDFTSVNSGVQFVAWLNGDIHHDFVCRVGCARKKQISLNISCGSTNYDSMQTSFLCRDSRYLTGDLFNVYAIDKWSKNIYIFRIGARNGIKMQFVRDYEVINYSPNVESI